MDAVCIKGGWDVLLAKDGEGQLIGVLVYHIRKYRGFTFILQPLMTAYNGIRIFYPASMKSHKKVAHEVKVTQALMDQLPPCSVYFQQYHPSFTNWLPFYWKGYKQSTRYTYLIDKSVGREALMQNLKGSLRRSLKKLEGTVEVRTHDYDSLWPMLVASFKERQKAVPYNGTAVKRLFENFKGTGRLIARGCHDKASGRLLAGLVMARDKERDYYLISFKMSEAPNGTVGHLLWETMLEIDTRITDFEGSMLKEVEYFLRAFGGTMTPHYKIHKVHNPLLRLAIPLLKPDLLG